MHANHCESQRHRLRRLVSLPNLEALSERPSFFRNGPSAFDDLSVRAQDRASLSACRKNWEPRPAHEPANVARARRFDRRAGILQARCNRVGLAFLTAVLSYTHVHNRTRGTLRRWNWLPNKPRRSSGTSAALKRSSGRHERIAGAGEPKRCGERPLVVHRGFMALTLRRIVSLTSPTTTAMPRGRRRHGRPSRRQR